MLDRVKLYKKIWSEPIGQLARSMGMPAIDLRRSCETLGVPVPPIGHWKLVKAGISVPVPELPAHDGPHKLPVEAKKRQSLAEWMMESREQVAPIKAPARSRAKPHFEKKAPVPASSAKDKHPRYITLREWAAQQFSLPPHINTLHKWVHEGRIQPQPVKIGRGYWVTPNAEYCSD